MIDQFIWREGPILSSEPKDLIDSKTEYFGKEVVQKALFLLENDMYLYILYTGLVDKEGTGLTDYIEFESLEEAKKVYYGIQEEN